MRLTDPPVGEMFDGSRIRTRQTRVKVPNEEAARIDEAKLREYLLSPTHPVGRFKAQFFRRLGYSRDDHHVLASDLLALLQNEIATTTENEFGTKYVVSGWIETPNGEVQRIVTVWMTRVGEDSPDLVTAYPGGGDGD